MTDRSVVRLRSVNGGDAGARGGPGLPTFLFSEISRERVSVESRKTARFLFHLAAVALLTADTVEGLGSRFETDELAALYEEAQSGERMQAAPSEAQPVRPIDETAGVLTCLVADDHPIVREAIKHILERSEIDVVGCARTGEEALREIEQKRPRVALVDLRLPFGNGIEVARRVSRDTPETAVILYTGADPLLLSSAWEGGARGFLLKEAPISDLVRAITMVAEGHVYIDPALAGFLVGSPAARHLDASELEILRLLADGLTTEAIAERLLLSVDGVRGHLRRLMGKLDVRTRTEAVASAIRQRLIA